MKTQGHVIRSVEPESIAAELGLEPGDVLLSVDGREMKDVFDYRFFTKNEEIVLLVRKGDGEEWELEIEKDEDEDLGIEFESGLMDDYRSCSNHCIFCFIDQNPRGMRETLYFKDDDARLSFLQGNYVTLTNMRDEDIDRIIAYRLQPINISVHTTDPELRVKMLRNRFAGQVLERIRRLYEADITMNGQIVLCRGINDGDELRRTIRDLSAFIPCMQSVSVVPVGLTRFREGLYPLEPFTGEDAREVLAIIHEEQERCMAAHGTHFIHAGDEWYILAGQPIPPAESYDGYCQLENGVGMMRLLTDEFLEALEEAEDREGLTGKCTIVVGMAAADLYRDLMGRLEAKFPGIEAVVAPIRNDFFGERITVSGLLTGQDLIAQLTGRDLGAGILITSDMLRSGEDVFLDDLTVADVERGLGKPVVVYRRNGEELLRAILDTIAGVI